MKELTINIKGWLIVCKLFLFLLIAVFLIPLVYLAKDPFYPSRVATAILKMIDEMVEIGFVSKDQRDWVEKELGL